MQAIMKGLEKVKQELNASENDGPVSDIFRKVSTFLLLIFFTTLQLLRFCESCILSMF